MNRRDIGILAELSGTGPSLERVEAFGCKVCQLVNWDMKLWTPDLAKKVREEGQAKEIEITSLWAGVPGPHVWDFKEGPGCLGLVPRKYRAERIASLKEAGAFARDLGVPAVITHLGFIPENPCQPEFEELMEAVREVALHLEGLGLEFWFETGQETPITLMRLIRAVGTSNLGINLDPANLLMYGKGNPVDAVELFKPYIRNIHAKDGMYPRSPMALGEEKRLGEGQVNFPLFLERLHQAGFQGALIIEREILGEEQKKDIREGIRYLGDLIYDLG